MAMTWEGINIFLTQFEKVSLCLVKKYSEYSLWEEASPLGNRDKINNFSWKLLANLLGKEFNVQ